MFIMKAVIKILMTANYYSSGITDRDPKHCVDISCVWGMIWISHPFAVIMFGYPEFVWR